MSPTSSLYVTPMRNAAPGQLEQTGAAATAAGMTMYKTGSTIADRVQDTMDEAQTKAAENQFLQTALPTLGQYKTTEGINATNQWDSTAQSIAKARQDARASLTNPIQQHMFDQVTNQHMLTFGEQMADHENVQRVQYGKDQSKARAQNMNDMATLDVDGRNRPDSKFAQLGAQSDAEVMNYAGLHGIAADSPQADQMLRENRTSRYASVIDALTSQHAYNEATDFFNEHKGEMDPKQAEKIESQLKSSQTLVQGTEEGNQSIQKLQKTSGAGPLSFPLPGNTNTVTPTETGLAITAATGTKVLAPANGTVSSVGFDPQRGNYAEISLPSGYLLKFDGLSAVNYKEGQKITEGQALGLSGKDDNGRAVTNYSAAAPDGTLIADPRTVVSAPFDPQNFYKPEDEAKVVSDLNANVGDEVVRRVAINRVESLANHNREVMNQQHADAVKQAMNFAVQHGGSIAGLDPTVSGQLTPVDLDQFNQEQKAHNDVNLLANWIQHPEQQTVNAVTLAHQQGRLSDNGYLTALRGAVALQGQDANSTDPQKVLGVGVDNEQIENTLLQNGHADIVNAKPAEPDKHGAELTPTQQTANQLVAQRVALQNEIKDQIDAEQQVSKSPLTRQQKQSIIDSTILNSQFLKAPGWTGGVAPWQLSPAAESVATYTTSTGKTVPYAKMPSALRPSIIQSLIQRRQPISEQNIYDTWVNAGMPGARR
ncbi:MAG: M23 family metallopeptidase [Terracidiphilus sp.]